MELILINWRNMKRITFFYFLLIIISACNYTYKTSQIDVTVNLIAKSMADKDITICAKITYIDANLTDMGHKFSTRTICKKGYVDQMGELSMEFSQSISDWSSAYEPRRAENFTADITDVKFYIKTPHGILTPKSVNPSRLSLRDHLVTGSVYITI